MADQGKKKRNQDQEPKEPVVKDKRRVDPETGDVRQAGAGSEATSSEPAAKPDAKQEAQPAAEAAEANAGQEPDAPGVPISDEDQALLDQAAADLVAEMRTDMLRAQAELVNFRTRVERDRAANREAVIAEVIRNLLPAIDDLERAREHGDLEEGTAMAMVAQKLQSAFERYGLRIVGEKGEEFDPNFHEAVVQVQSADVTVNTVADVIEIGYALGDRLIRAAKVAVSVPAE